MADPHSRPAWLADELFPFRSRFLELAGNRIHYVDEGDGPLLLLLHGNPTWSFLYRHLIRKLRGDFRCIAPDYPGFGLSRPAAGYGFTPREHAGVVSAFVRALDLSDIRLMVQDWGGPIGLHAAAQEPRRYAGFIIGNTWCWPVSRSFHFRWFSRLLGGVAGRFAIRRFNAFVNVLIPLGTRKRTLSRKEMTHYRRPFPTPESRTPTHIFPREIMDSEPFLREAEAGLPKIADKPALIVWGGKDPAFRAHERERFESLFPRHETHVLHGAGHYIQEDAPEAIAAALRRWVQG